jgi:hypothetical protein
MQSEWLCILDEGWLRGFGFSFDSPVGPIIERDQWVDLGMEQLDLHTLCDRKI